MITRAYSLLTIKAVDEDERVIEGIATTPAVDRVGDIVEPLGVKYKNPLPLLHQHRSDQPVGSVRFNKPTKEGVTFKAKLPKIDEPGPLKDRIDTAWLELKLGLVRGVSIGFRALEDGWERLEEGGIRFTAIEVMELSLVTIPALAEASITLIKQYDTGEPAATGTATRVKSPGVSGPVKALKPKPERDRMTIKEQITQFENTRAAKAARRSELMTKAGENGETLDAAQEEEYDTLKAEIATIDKHLVRLNEALAEQKAAAVPVTATDTATAAAARATTQVITVKPRVEKGMTFVRYSMAIAANRGNKYEAAEYAKQRWPDQPELQVMLKAAVAAGTTTDATWAGPLATVTASAEFLELLRPSTLIGKIGGLRRVPFNTSVKAQTGGGTYSWVGQGAAKPVSALAFSTVTLPFAKASGIIVITKELSKLSTPAAEGVVRDDMIAGMQQFLDTQFIDPAVAISANVSPASITNGVAGTAASGTTEAAARADLRALIKTFTTNNIGLAGVVLIMSEDVAFTLGTIVNAVGEPAFPGISISGGNILGIPVVTSNVVGAQIVAVHAPSVLYADDDQTEIDVSEEASIQMDSAPANPTDATTVMVSLWQRNLIGLRADRFITWLKARANVVQRIHTVAYA